MKKLFLIFLPCLLILTTCKKDDSSNCPEGYEGPTCEIEILPTKIIFSNWVVNYFPATNNGAPWDDSSGPDLKITLRYNSTLVTTSSLTYEDYTGSAPVSMDFTAVLEGDDLATDLSYSVNLVEEDATIDEWMGGYIFTPYIENQGFPTTRTMDLSSVDVGFTFDISYEW